MKYVKLFESFINEGWDTYGNSGNFSIGNKKVAWQIRYLFDSEGSNAQIMVDTAQFAEAMGLNGTELVGDYFENMAIVFIKPWNDKKNWRELSPEDFDITEPSKKYKNAADFIKWVKPFNPGLEDDLQYY
jgi:hypothetical protein